MKYGIIGAFIKLAFAKTAFGYIEKEIPGIDLPSYKKRVLSEYKASVARTPGVGSMKDNMFVMTMYYNDLKDPSVPGAFRLLSRIADGFMKMQIVKIEFREA